MEELVELRTKSTGAGATPTAEGTQWMNNVPGTISSLFKSSDDQLPQIQYDYTILSLSVCLLGHGYVDEAHALVTPYSWPEEIYTSYGPVRYSNSDAGVVSVATYIHSLVHRREGWNIGELGMIGWANADYWGASWSRPYLQQADLQKQWKGPIAGVQSAIYDLATKNAAGMDWLTQNLPELANENESNRELSWDPRALHRLCAQATKDDGETASDDLIDFAEKAVEAELHAILNHCVTLAGFCSPMSCKE